MERERNIPNGNGAIRSNRSQRAGLVANTSRCLRAILFCQKEAEAIDHQLRSNVTQVHVTALDEVVSVNSFFCVAVFVGLAVSPNPSDAPPLAPSDRHCQVKLNTYRYLLVFEVVAFGCFLFSSLVAHGIKLYIILGNGQEADNVKSASVNNRVLRLGILFAALGSALGSVFMTLSLVNMIQIKLGSFTCRSVWTLLASIPLMVLFATGVIIFTSSVLFAFRR